MTPQTNVTRIGHWSGRWDAPVSSWGMALRTLAARCSVATLTETPRDRTFQDLILPLGWLMARLDDVPGESECSVGWNTAAWNLASAPYSVQVATTTWKISGHERPPVHLLVTPLEHIDTGNVVLFGVVHAPSDVEGKTGLKSQRPGSVQAHIEVTDGILSGWRKGWNRHPGATRVLAADWNLSYRRPWVQGWFAGQYPELEACWEQRLPRRGTHGSRVIDWTAVGRGGLEVDRAYVIKTRPAGFDHRGIITRATFKS